MIQRKQVEQGKQSIPYTGQISDQNKSPSLVLDHQRVSKNKFIDI